MRTQHTAWFSIAFVVGCMSWWQATCSGGDGGDEGPTSVSSQASVVSAASSGSGGQTAMNPCTACGQPEDGGALVNAAIDEASGLAASHAHPGVYYVNNDSGDTPRVFAIDASGAERGIYHVGNAEAFDWEGLAVGPCGEGASCIFAGDIGDNLSARSEYVVYRVREPLSIAGGEHTLPSEALVYTYPDGSHNSETVLVDPESGELYVVTKVEEGISALYRFPTLSADAPVVLEKLTDVSPPEGSPQITGGDIHPTRLGVLLRTYTHIWFYPITSSVGDALTKPPCAVPVATEAQGETVAWTLAGDGYLTVSEGVGSTIFATHCGR